MSGDVEIRPQWLTVAMAVVASLAFAVGCSDGGPRWPIAVEFAGVALGTAVLHLLALRVERRSRWTERLGQWSVVLVGLGTVLGAQLPWFGTGWPLEIVLVAALRNVVLATAVLSYVVSFRRSTAILGTFAVVFSTALTTDPLFYGLVVVFAGLGVCWLMTTYWSTLRGTMLAASEEHRPRRWVFALPLLVGACLLSVPIVARDDTRAMFGLLPSSGGTGAYDAAARSGIGNGDMLVAARKDVQSFAPIDDAPFMNSHEPSLFDCLDENYEEGFKKSTSDRAIALPPDVLAELKERHLKTSERANREFSTLRQPAGTRRREEVESIRDDALLFVAGRTPVHLRTTVYDVYDGTTWHEEPLPDDLPPLRMTDVDGEPWLAVRSVDERSDFTESVSHAVKFVNLRSSRMPLPPNTIGLRIADVDRAEMFEWKQPSIVSVARKRVPPLLVAHTSSTVVDADVFREQLLPPPRKGTQHGLVPEGEDYERIARLAERWVADVPVGWRRVERIVERLRSEYVHDPDARPPRGVESPALHFLFESKRGPDYQFATAAVLLFRSLGYSARLVGGFYADPEDYDARTRHTPIRTDDVHTWAEVRIGGDVWVTVEPTPGYEVLGPPPSPWQRFVAIVVAVAWWAWANVVAILGLLLATGLLYTFRFDLLDIVHRFAWRVRRPREERRAAMRALAIVEGRLAALGLDRPEGTTPRRWFESIDGLAPAVRGRFLNVVRLADWAAFAPQDAPRPAVDESTSDRVVLEDTLSALRRSIRSETTTSSPNLLPTPSNPPGQLT